jgi:hypothetical protein
MLTAHVIGTMVWNMSTQLKLHDLFPENLFPAGEYHAINTTETLQLISTLF